MRHVLVMNSGSLNGHAFDDPTEVTAGVIAGFDGDAAVIDFQTDAAPESFFLLLGGADGRRTPIIHLDRIEKVTKKAYAAPTLQVTTLTPITTGTAGPASVKVIDRTQGFYPEPTITSEVQVTAGMTAAEIIQALVDRINSVARRVVNASKTAEKVTIEITASATGDGTITIDGTEYTVTHSVNIDGTGAGFVTAEAANILAAHDIVVTYNSATNNLIFTAGSGDADLPEITTTDGEVTFGEPVASNAALVLTAREAGTSFFTAVGGVIETVPVVSTTVPSLGSGTYEQVLKMERENLGYMTGETYVNSGILGRPDAPPTYAASGSNYTIYTLKVRSWGPEALGNAVRGAAHFYVDLCIDADVTGNFDTFLAAFLS